MEEGGKDGRQAISDRALAQPEREYERKRKFGSGAINDADRLPLARVASVRSLARSLARSFTFD